MLAFVGETGNGKSSLANTLVQRKVFEAQDPDSDCEFDLASTTKTVQEAETVYKEQMIKIKDTMGLSDTDLAAPRHEGDKSAYDGYREIFHAVSQQVSNASDAGVDVFLWCVSTRQKFGEQKHEEFELLKNIFGEGIVKHIILVFTSGGSRPILEFKSTTPALDAVRGELGETCITHSEIRASRKSMLSDTEVQNASRERVLDCVLRLRHENGGKKYNAAEAMKNVDYLMGIVDSLEEPMHCDAARTYFLEFLRGQKSLRDAEARIRPLREAEDKRREEEDQRRIASWQRTGGKVGAGVGLAGGFIMDVAVPTIGHAHAALVPPLALAGGVFIAGRAMAGRVHRCRHPPPQTRLRPPDSSSSASDQLADGS